ncbi:hypothetical protein NDA16_002990 [Ustilago loliicola]|nr:hypothetical protein NDA16_002990 [Ustilago loliicola]
MCGITALLLASVEQSAAPEINEALSLLQHRGQDAAGIVTCGNKGRFYQCKANGMVRDVFDVNAIARLQGNMGVGHVRYPTAGSSAHSEAQPFYVNSPYGITFAHNGNLINTDELRRFLDADAHRHINTDSDSEVLLNIFANNLQKTGKFRINEEDIFTAIRDLMKQCKGGYTCIAMLAGFGIIAFRDPNGIRPLGMCSRTSSAAESGELDGHGKDYCFTSESVVCDALGFEDFEDIKPGEAVIITKHAVSRRILTPPADSPDAYPFSPDIFEYVYFARPDSVMDGVSVYRSRMAMGDKLADEVRRQIEATGMSIDVVIPVPDTSRVAALQLAQNLGVPYREGFIKNRYVGRTFIMPGQSVRRKNVRRKLNAMALEFSGKNVLIVDDSIVRGTTSKEIIQMARDAGAKKVIMASCAPPIRYSNVYGIDMPSRQELVAYGRTVEKIAEYIQADMVIYQTLEDLIDSVQQFNPDLKKFDCSVFDGHYVTGGVDAEYIAHLEHLRSENAKAKKAATNIPVISENQKKIYASRASPAASSVAGGPMDGANDEKMATDPSAAVLNGAANGNGANGNRKRRLNDEELEEEEKQQNIGCSGPMNGADDIGLFNSWTR